MKICVQNSPVFKRRLKSSEEAEYSDVLKRGKAKVNHTKPGEGKTILIIPASSLPQSAENCTGVGNLASENGLKFIEFAKKYWGINELQINPIGQYHNREGAYPFYSGTSMDLGNHVINLSDFLTQEEFKQVVGANKIKDRVNFSNIVDLDSVSEKLLKDVYKRMSPAMKQEFEQYKKENADILDRKGLFRALTEINGSADYRVWNETDRNLFNDSIVTNDVREKRNEEIQKLKSESIEFFKFKNFLAEKSLNKAKADLNSKGIRLDGDLPCKFADEEVWTHPKAFLQNIRMKNWRFPVLDQSSPEAELILRQKVREYARHFDGFRVDASWTYIAPKVFNELTGVESTVENGDLFLKIIEDEVKKVKGEKFELNNIMHEFAANPKKEFDIHNSAGSLKSVVRDRVKIYTSGHLSGDWGSANAFLERHWSEDKFIIGATNHDSPPMEGNEKQVKALAKILKINPEKLKNTPEFIKAKFAEPLRAKNNMLFFLSALGIHEKFQHNGDKKLDWARKVPENYEDEYFKALTKGVAFNPMDALEKQFIAQGLDKSDPDLFRKIVKYRKILEKKEGAPLLLKIGAVAAVISVLGVCSYKYYAKHQEIS